MSDDPFKPARAEVWRDLAHIREAATKGTDMTIPDDVMEVAHVVRRRCDPHIRTNGVSFYLDAKCDEIVARAIMAERERCAKIANGFESDADPDAGSIIAAAIRRGPTPPKGGDNEAD